MKKINDEPRGILLDIEASSLNADFGTTLCVGMLWTDEGKVMVPSLLDYPTLAHDPTNDKQLLKDVSRVLSEADYIVTYYGKGFDLPFLTARMLHHKMLPLPPIPHIDLYFTARTHLKMHSRRLGSVGEFLGLNVKKTPVSGSIWVRAMAGHRPSIRYVVEHCRADVLVLHEAYLRLRPFIRLHPAIGRPELGECRFCGHDKLQSRGFQLSQNGRRRRVVCTRCASWDTRKVGAV